MLGPTLWSTVIGPNTRCHKPTPCLRNLSGWKRAIPVGSFKKIAILWICKHLLGRTTLGLMESKVQILHQGPLSRFPLTMRPCRTRSFTDKPKIPGCLLQRKHEGSDVWMRICLSLSVWHLSNDHNLRGICDWKMISKLVLSSNMWLSAAESPICWESYVPSRKKRHQQRVSFQASI